MAAPVPGPVNPPQPRPAFLWWGSLWDSGPLPRWSAACPGSGGPNPQHRPWEQLSLCDGVIACHERCRDLMSLPDTPPAGALCAAGSCGLRQGRSSRGDRSRWAVWELHSCHGRCQSWVFLVLSCYISVRCQHSWFPEEIPRKALLHILKVIKAVPFPPRLLPQARRGQVHSIWDRTQLRVPANPGHRARPS